MSDRSSLVLWIAAGGLWLPAGCSSPLPQGDGVVREPIGTFKSICGLSHPESVAASGARRFVSNIGAELDASAADGDGFLSELDADGGIVELRAFAPEDAPLNAPKGLAVVGDRLYVADIDRVVGFALDSREPVFEAVLKGEPAPRLNDLVVEDEQHLLVSDTAGNRVLRLDLGAASFDSIAKDVVGADGIALDDAGNRAFVVGSGGDAGGGKLYEIPLDDPGATHVIDGPVGVFDGLALLSSGQLIASDQVALDKPIPGKLITFATTGEHRHSWELSEELHGPADFYYDRRAELLWIPESIDDCVQVLPAPR